MATTAREELHAFLATLYGSQADPALQAQFLAWFNFNMQGAPGVPLNDPEHKIKNVLPLSFSLALPKFTEGGYVLIPDPRNGPEAQALHDKFRDLNVAAQQEQSDASGQ